MQYWTVANWGVRAVVVLLVLPACWGDRGERGAQDRSQGATSETTSSTPGAGPACDGEPDDLVNPRMSPAQAGDRLYEYHRVAEDDFDGDGVRETAHVIAQMVKGPDGQYMGDPEPAHHVYVEEPSGERTYVFSNFLWSARLEVDLSDGEPPSFILQWDGLHRFAVWCAAYLGPGKVETTKVASFGRSHGSFRQVE